MFGHCGAWTVRDPEVGIVLSPAPRQRRSGYKPRGLGRHDRWSEDLITAAPPSAPVPLYRGCRNGCTCHRCAYDRMTYWQQFKACARFRSMAEEPSRATLQRWKKRG